MERPLKTLESFQPHRNKWEKILLISLLLAFASPVLAAVATGNTSLPNWLKVPNDLYGGFYDSNDELSSKILVKTYKGKDEFIPPLHYVERKGSDVESANQLFKKILERLDVDPHAAETKLSKDDSDDTFKPVYGPKHDLPGKFLKYFVKVAGNDVIVCVGLVRTKAQLHAVYLKSFVSNYPDCKKDVTEILRSETFVK